MSLLDRGNEDVVVFLSAKTTDRDGNVIWTRSTNGTPTQARLQVSAQSGTSSRRAEDDNEGYVTEQVYRMRLPRSFPHVLDAFAQIEWRGARWSVFGEPFLYAGSRNTRRYEYQIRRL